MNFSPERLAERLRALPPARQYRVAFSGGVDSHALLHALARAGTFTLDAVHVNHGLHPDADAWATHARGVCEALGVPLTVIPVQARPAPGESPEAAARAARYAALAAGLSPGTMLLTAHHRDDQAETLLLQLLRGAGPAGLAAMPAWAPLGRGLLGRPLLDFDRDALTAYAAAAGLAWIEDPANRDPAVDRSYLRHRVLPLLRARWPALGETLGRAARHQGEAAGLLEGLAATDLAAARGAIPGTLSVPAVAALGGPRQRNLLRHWLAQAGLPAPPARVLARVGREVLGARADAAPRVHWAGGEVRRHRDALYALAPLPAHDPACTVAWDPARPAVLDDAGGTVWAEPAPGRGVDAARLRGGRVELRYRRGGERCRPAGRGHTHAVKKLLQERGVPPWERARLPLVYVDGELAAVPDLWVCEGFAAAAGRPGLVLHWSRLSAPPPA